MIKFETVTTESAAALEHPLRNASYRRWLFGSAASSLGDQFYLVALPWLVLQQLGSAGALGTVLMAGAFPRVVLALIGGAASDRFSARRVMLVAAVVRALCVSGMGALTCLGVLYLWDVYVLVIIFSIADAFALPAQTAYVPALLKREQLVAGMSLEQGVVSLAYIVGPLPAGLVIGRFGAGTAFMVDAIGFLAVIVALLRLPDAPTSASNLSAMGAIGDGIASVLNDVPLRTLIIMLAALNCFSAGAVYVGLPYLARSSLGSSAAYGFILSVGAVGSLAATLVGSVWKVRRRGVMILACTGLLGLGLMSIPFVPGLWGVAGIVLVMCAATSLTNLHILAWIMQRVDATVRGRVSSVLMLGSVGTAPLSMAAAGFIAEWSVTGLFVLAGACQAMVTVAIALLRSVREIE